MEFLDTQLCRKEKNDTYYLGEKMSFFFINKNTEIVLVFVCEI